MFLLLLRYKATMNIIQLNGRRPANSLEAGGGACMEEVLFFFLNLPS
jgi:succinyl-CoA synthetase beta subunit